MCSAEMLLKNRLAISERRVGVFVEVAIRMTHVEMPRRPRSLQLRPRGDPRGNFRLPVVLRALMSEARERTKLATELRSVTAALV